jgi:hypothetical protein
MKEWSNDFEKGIGIGKRNKSKSLKTPQFV